MTEIEPAKEVKRGEGEPEGSRFQFKYDLITMSSRWSYEKMQPWNPIKTNNFNPNWGKGEFTCIHTMDDDDGPWWKASFGMPVIVTRVQILNRLDCCAGRIN